MTLNINQIREMFPITKHKAYFVTNAIGPLPLPTAKTLQQMVDDLQESVIPSLYLKQNHIINECRMYFSRLLGCNTQEVGFTRNTSEGLLRIVNSLKWQEGDEVLVVEGDFPTVFYPWMSQKEPKINVRVLSQNNYRITPDCIASALTNKTRVLTLSSVQWNTGFRADLKKIGEICRNNGTLFVVDACLSLGVIPHNVYGENMDVLVASCYKFLFGLPGLGIFFCRKNLLKELKEVPLAWGGIQYSGFPWMKAYDFVERDYPFEPRDDISRFEEGMQNHLALKAQITSLKLLEEIGIDNIESYVKKLSDFLIEGAKAKGYKIISPRSKNEWSHLVRIQSAEKLAENINKKLTNQNIIAGTMYNCLIFALSIFNTKEEIDKVLSIL